jgi:carboxylesterase
MYLKDDIVALHFPFRKRALSESEKLLIQPFFIPGSSTNKKTGILMIHGLSATPAIWRGLAQTLTTRGFTLSAPLLAGHGQYAADLLNIRWQDWYQSVERAFHELSQECSEIIVIGHSLGGTLALQLTAAHPSIKHLFLISSAVYPTSLLNFSMKIGLIPFLKMIGIKFFSSIGGNLKKADAWEFCYSRVATQALIEVYACMAMTQKILPQVKSPATLFQAHQDLLVPSHRTQELLENIGSQQKELIWFDNSYHVILLDNDADQLIKAITERI